jgi:hypothetical protein
MVTKLTEKGHKVADIPLFEAIELVKTGEYDWKLGNIVQKRMTKLNINNVSIEEILDDLTMRYIYDDLPFNEWYAALRNAESDDLRGLIARLVGRMSGSGRWSRSK